MLLSYRKIGASRRTGADCGDEDGGEHCSSDSEAGLFTGAHQARLIMAIRDAAVGALQVTQQLGLYGRASSSLPTAMRAAAVRQSFDDSKAQQTAL